VKGITAFLLSTREAYQKPLMVSRPERYFYDLPEYIKIIATASQPLLVYQRWVSQQFHTFHEIGGSASCTSGLIKRVGWLHLRSCRIGNREKDPISWVTSSTNRCSEKYIFDAQRR